jgi:hypothetical protein
VKLALVDRLTHAKLARDAKEKRKVADCGGLTPLSQFRTMTNDKSEMTKGK